MLIQVLIGLLVIGGLVLLGWYLLIKTEGVYLGWRVVIGLYDLYAGRYDQIKDYDETYERFFLGRPIVNHLRDTPAPLVLDVATGTGRLPCTLLEQDDFHGHVIGLDLSRRMLLHAAVNLAGFAGRYDLVWYTAAELPFPDDTFDLVTCIEALEFLPSPFSGLRELIRVLRPGGVLLITNRRGLDAWLMPGRTIRTPDLLRLLTDEWGLVDVQDERWQVDYDLIWARKSGSSPPTGVRPLAEVLRCPVCAEVAMLPLESHEWVCTSCESRIPVGSDGVIELFHLRR